MNFVGFGVRWVGMVYLSLGTLGLLPVRALHPLHGHGATPYLFNLVATNTLHNLLHVAIGASGLWFARDPKRARWWGRMAGGLLLLLFVLGMVQAAQEGFPDDQRLFGRVPLNAAGHILHAATGALALCLGLAREKR